MLRGRLVTWEELVEFGILQGACSAVLNDILKPAKIYFLVFGESGIQSHQHVLPRTLDLTDRFFQEFGKEGDWVEGPIFFAWVRKHSSAAGALSANTISVTNRPRTVEIDGFHVHNHHGPRKLVFYGKRL